MSSVMHVPQCKVCNSQFRNEIEALHTKGMSPEKIYQYLQTLTGNDAQIVKTENIAASAIRRHMANHFDIQDGVSIKSVETKKRIEKSRDAYQQGVAITVDKINSLTYMIETAMTKMEEVDELNSPIKEHQLTISYMNTIKGLIESLAKLTGDLKQEGTIDVNFFSTEITKFAEIILNVIRQIDQDMGLNHQLENKFSDEFKKQWADYNNIQQGKINGTVPLDYGNKELNTNNFNEL